jgi:hypothetical protein
LINQKKENVMTDETHSRRTAFAAVAALAALAGTTMTAGSAMAQDRDHMGGDRDDHDRYPSLRRAIDALQDARRDIAGDRGDFGGHRRDALEAIDRATDQLRMAIDSDRHRGPLGGIPDRLLGR